MGFKRPFDAEEFQELPFKHSKPLDYSNKLIQFSQDVPFSNDPKKPDTLVENEGVQKFQWVEALENDSGTEVLADKDCETGTPLSRVTSGSGEEDTGSGETAYSSLSLEYSDFYFPRRTFVPHEDVYSSVLDRPPRMHIPLGPDHQASLPPWSRHIKNNQLDSSNPSSSFFRLLGPDHENNSEYENRMMGTCIIPMPNSNFSAHRSDEAGDGIMGCRCLDRASVACVRQHVMEAQERLRNALGHELFANLGLSDMGEEVAHKWSGEEERVFHEVVYSHPASLGQNFWKHLAAVFPSRTKMELVSYYFNVFMLRRRASQNRSTFLDIDSDDDEWHGVKGGSNEVRGSEEYSLIKSFVNQNDQVNHSEDSFEEEDDDDDDDDDGDGGNDYIDGMTEDCGINFKYEGHVKSSDGGRLSSQAQHVGKVSGGVGEDFGVQDDSCVSFELQSNAVDTCGPGNDEAVKTNLSKVLQSEVNGANDLMSHVYLSDSCDAKFWDSRYTMGPIRGVDFLPTCNIIEEIFGQGTWDTDTRDE